MDSNNGSNGLIRSVVRVASDVDFHQNCTVCAQPLFSTGQRVVKVRGCNHHLHQCCLGRSSRIRRVGANGSTNSERRCPACPPNAAPIGLIEPVSFPKVASLFDHTNLQGISTTQAKKIVQYLLWSSASNMTENIARVLEILTSQRLPAIGFVNRFPLVQGSGLIQACMHIIKENPNEDRVLFWAARLLRYCFELGHQEDSIAIARENVDGVFEVPLGESAMAMASDDFYDVSMSLITTLVGDEFDNDERKDEQERFYRALYARFNRIIPTVVAVMKASPNCQIKQKNGCEFFQFACCLDECVGTIIESGALSVLHVANYRHNIEAACEALGVLLDFDLQRRAS